MKIVGIEKSVAKKLVNGTLPDIDSDFTSKERGLIKKYIEDRYGSKQVCSVGTFTTMRVKGLVKDLARTVSVDFSEANLISSMISKDDKTFLSLIQRAQKEPKLKEFIKKNSELFYILPTLLNQPKTQSIHPCAMIVFPKVMEASEWCPTRFQQGQLVSEWSGTQMDDAGFLKDDILGIRQLDKFTDILQLIRENDKEAPDIYHLPHDPEVYRYFTNGWNGDVFQFSSAGLVGYTKTLKPQNLNDLTVAVAVYRPGPMSSHYHEIYAKCKNEGRTPEFLWGTEEITRDTYGLLIYQEQVMEMCRQVGDLSMREADDVRRAMGKLKLHALLGWSEKIKKGFLAKGATEEQFKEVWDATVEFAKYCFNKSHSVAYAMTGYISQYLKVNFPIEYWTVALDYANEEDTISYLSEILQAKRIHMKPPDINKSGIHMFSDQESSTIFWGIHPIKGIGEDTARQIIKERDLRGPYKSFADFYFRNTFKGSKVKKQTYEALIGCGAFDRLYKIGDDVERRMFLINRYRKFKKVKVSNPTRDAYTIGDTEQTWWWRLQQKKLTGLAFINYEEIVKESGIDGTFCTAKELSRNQDRGIFRSFGGYIVEVRLGRSKKGQYARLTIEQNYVLTKVLVWSEEFARFEDQLKNSEKSLIVFNGELKYEDKWTKGNQFTLKQNSDLIVL